MRNHFSNSSCPPYVVTTIVRELEKPEDPFCVVQDQGRQEVIQGKDISRESARFVDLARKGNRQIVSALLLNTPGGFVDVCRPVSATVQYLQYHDIPTWSFVDDRAQSCGGQLYMDSNTRIVRGLSEVMFHQTYEKEDSGGSTSNRPDGQKQRLVYPRAQFRDELMQWLRKNADPAFVQQAMSRARLAFADPENHLDDVTFKGWELQRFGLADRLVQGRSGLAAAYQSATGIHPDEWHPSVREFFSYR